MIIILLLMLLNLSTFVLLDSLADSIQSWRLAQHDITIARAERALQSALAYSVTQLQLNHQVPVNLAIGADWQANIFMQQQECSKPNEDGGECVHLHIHVEPLNSVSWLHQVKREHVFELNIPSNTPP